MTSCADVCAQHLCVLRTLCRTADGQFVLCGSEDGTVTIWDFATATPTPVGHMALGHAPIHSMAWSSAFHAVAVCSFGHFAPIRVLGCAAEQPQVALKPPCPEAARGKVIQGTDGAVFCWPVCKRLRWPPQGASDCLGHSFPCRVGACIQCMHGEQSGNTDSTAVTPLLVMHDIGATGSPGAGDLRHAPAAALPLA